VANSSRGPHLQTLGHIQLSDNLCLMVLEDLLGLLTTFHQVLEATDQLAARQAATRREAFAAIPGPRLPCRGPDLPEQLAVLLGLLCLEMCPVMTPQLSEQPTWREQNNWQLSKEKRLPGNKRWPLGCSRCRWRDRIQEQT